MFGTLVAIGLASGALALIFRKSLEKAFERLSSGGTNRKESIDTSSSSL
jgi:HAMP domain-containing protein